MAALAVAVTGDVGAGKSTVSRLLERLSGGLCLDADAAAWDLWRREDIVRAAAARWGKEVLGPDGGILRPAVASRVFSDPEEYRWCCGLLHPPVMAELGRRVAELGPSRWAIVEVPLLFEVGRPGWVDAVVFVTAPWDVRARRCREQRGWDEAELRRRESFFLPSEERMRRSDFVLHNAGGLADLEAGARQVVERLERSAEKGAPDER